MPSIASARSAPSASQPARKSEFGRDECDFDLDEFSETAFDDLVRVAANLCQTPAAVIAIVDGERRWFRAKLSSKVVRLPRETAFCTQNILDTQTLWSSLTSKDPRFTAIGEPEVCFYAGAPLMTSSGQAIGAVCVMDRGASRTSS